MGTNNVESEMKYEEDLKKKRCELKVQQGLNKIPNASVKILSDCNLM